MSAGKRFREALASESPLQIAGTVNAYCALLAEQAEFKAIYLSGAGVANASYGLPDLGITGLQDVLEDARRICSVSDLPLLVDIDTGWGGAFNIARAVRSLTDCGVAAVHIEDQVGQKRCGHRPNKEIVSRTEMVDRIKAAVDAKTDAAFMIMARTDALAVEGMDAMLDRLHAYVEAGADAIFAEAMTDIEMYEQITREISVRAMSAAALDVYRRIRQDGTQRGVVEKMQTREALYDVLGYHAFEQKLDVLFGKTTHEKGKM
jgi:methylisocitrate lyase